jgi:hypothetical protein
LKNPRRSNSSVGKPLRAASRTDTSAATAPAAVPVRHASPASAEVSHLRASALSGNESRAPPGKRSRNGDCRVRSFPRKPRAARRRQRTSFRTP